MVSIPSLWLPILLSAVGVFLVSSIIHMVLPYHRVELFRAQFVGERARRARLETGGFKQVGHGRSLHATPLRGSRADAPPQSSSIVSQSSWLRAMVRASRLRCAPLRARRRSVS